MTNLEYLDKFITETYGAICFHNAPEDGYARLSDGVTMETLAIYFANELDLYDADRKERLTRAAGEKFYERYVGARGKKLCTLNSCMILTRYERNGVTRGIHLHFPIILGGGVMDIINYFAGNNISGRRLELPNNVNMPIPTNNDFRLDSGDEIKTVLEEYLSRKGLPLITEENGFFVNHENISYKAEGFWDNIVRVQEIQSKRQARMRQAFNFLTESDRKIYDEEMGVDNDIDEECTDDSAPEVRSNLQAAEKFFTEAFGAICFYNDPEDGYVKLGDDKKIETLSIYFANRLDCKIDERRARLVKAAGEQFYERYIGTNGMLVCGMLGGLTLAAYYVEGNPIAVKSYGSPNLCGGISLIIDYFCGKNINRLSAYLIYFTKDLPTNCGLKIKKGMPIMDTVDRFFLKNRIEPLRAGFNYVSQQEKDGEFDCDFGNVEDRISQIAEKRKKAFNDEFLKISEEDYQKFVENRGFVIVS